ncbi:MAG: PIN/TRAM domain-containing protein, partial [Vicinamibacteria bacterium]
MTTLQLVRLMALAAGALVGAMLALSLGTSPLTGAAAGLLMATLAIALEVGLENAPMQTLVWSALGAGAGLLIGFTLGAVIAPVAGGAGPALWSGLPLVGAWVGAVVGARRAEELPALRRRPPSGETSVLDTSVIVDGRIADVVDAGFVGGRLLVPRMVVRELQTLADGSDPLRRSRGRRGFDVLDKLRQSATVELVMDEGDIAPGGEVDAALVALAQARGARLLTNDAALGRVAALAGVPTGNLNDLAGALRSAALPGEGLLVQVTREGKEVGQGVAYLDDGTMVVIEGGKRHLGQSL